MSEVVNVRTRRLEARVHCTPETRVGIRHWIPGASCASAADYPCDESRCRGAGKLGTAQYPRSIAATAASAGRAANADGKHLAGTDDLPAGLLFSLVVVIARRETLWSPERAR